jgi:hypothetical protein
LRRGGDIQAAAARALTAIPPVDPAKANEVIGKLLPLLESGDSDVQESAALALAAIPPSDPAKAKEVIGKLPQRSRQGQGGDRQASPVAGHEGQ